MLYWYCIKNFFLYPIEISNLWISIDSFVQISFLKYDYFHSTLISPPSLVSYLVLLWNYTSERSNHQFVEKKQCVYLWDTSFGYARRRCVEYFTRLECLAAPIHRLFSLTRSRIHRSVCSPAVVTKFWMCKEVCRPLLVSVLALCSNVSISLLSKFIRRTYQSPGRFDEEIRTIDDEQHHIDL